MYKKILVAHAGTPAGDETLRHTIHVDLSMKVDEIQDSKGVIRKMKGIGHYDAGYSRASVKDLSEIPYLIELIGQSYAKSVKNSYENKKKKKFEIKLLADLTNSSLQ